MFNRQIVIEVLRYLISHPEAKDTVQGIKRWWLGSSILTPIDSEVEEALAFIAREGFLEERSVTPQQRVFAAKAGSLKPARRFLQQLIRQSHEVPEDM